MHFGQPENLWWLLILVPMAAGLAYYLWWKRKVVERVGHLPMVRKMAARSSAPRQVTRGILVIVATALLCVSAARPQWGQDDRTLKRFGVDVVFALDISKSMLAQDVPPNRLDAARSEIRQTLTTLTGDRVGMVVFTAVSFAQSPLTTDYGAIRFYLEKLDPNQMPVGGTSVGQAIWDAIELLTGAENADGASEDGDDREKSNTQIIVLITDGEDHESNPMQMAERARELGIKIVTVGLGNVDGSRIPLYGPGGDLRGYKRDRKGELVYTKLDDTTLKKIADETGGTYIHYSGENSVVNALDDYIDQLEKREIETMLRERYKDRYMYFLAPALLLLLIALALGERRKIDGSGPPGGLSTTMIVLLAALAVGLGGCESAFEDTLDSVDRGNRLVEEEKYEEALEAYQQAEKETPARPELHYDLGLAYLGAEDFENAREAFARALSTDDPQLEFDALFNLGLALSGQEKWQEALETYKQALRVDLDATVPANKDRIEQARHNLETVFRRLYPPCAQLEDDLEDNDQASAATQLDELDKEDLTLCGLDDDWYAIPAMPGTNISVEVNFEELRDEPDPERVFLKQPQDLRLSLFDSTGEEIIAVDQGDEDDFDPDATSATRRIEQLEVTEDMLADAQGMLLLKVDAVDGLEFSYDLSIEAIPPCHALEDDFEENDTREAARTIESGQHKLHYCPGDDDWYSIDMEVGDSVFIDLQPQEDAEREEPPTLSARLMRASDGEVVANSQKQGPLLALGVREVEQPGEYLLHVTGATDDEQGPYNAQIYQFAPCPAGDDRFEDNDDPTQAATLPKEKPIHRYLRICEGDRDFFEVEPDEDGEISWGLRRARIDAPERTGEDQPMSLDLLDASGDKMLAEGETPKTPANAPTGDAPGPAVDSAVTIEDFDGESALLRASGPQDFYHLVQLNPQQQDQDDQNNEDDEDNEGDQDEDEQQEDGDSEDSEDSEDEEEEDKGDESDEQKQDEEKDEEKDESSKAEDEKKAEEKEAREEAAREAEERRDPEEERTEDILRALEEHDSNFQMRKALEDMPERDIERDW
ncbi:MAG: VWA domain-containing protein [Myxococcota bacterium]